MKIGIISDTHGLLRPEVIEALGGCEAILHGGDITGQNILDELGNDYDLVVFGHSHKYEEVRQGKTLMLNPGSCGPRRFHQAITMAIVEIVDGIIEVTRIDIPQRAGGALSKSGSADLKKQIEVVIKETQKNHSPEAIANRYGYDKALTEQIVRLYLTHPGVTSDGIMTKMGY